MVGRRARGRAHGSVDESQVRQRELCERADGEQPRVPAAAEHGTIHAGDRSDRSTRDGDFAVEFDHACGERNGLASTDRSRQLGVRRNVCRRRHGRYARCRRRHRRGYRCRRGVCDAEIARDITVASVRARRAKEAVAVAGGVRAANAEYSSHRGIVVGACRAIAARGVTVASVRARRAKMRVAISSVLRAAAAEYRSHRGIVVRARARARASQAAARAGEVAHPLGGACELGLCMLPLLWCAVNQERPRIFDRARADDAGREVSDEELTPLRH